MKDLTNSILNEKQDYVNSIRKAVSKYKEICIYGAGKTAEIVYRVLKNEDISISKFIVTDASMNRALLFDKPVVELSNVKSLNEDMLIILGVRRKWSKSVIEGLRAKGYRNIIEPAQYLNYFEESAFDDFTKPKIEITTRIGCKVNCKYCPQELLCNSYDPNEHGELIMSFETFKTCIDKTPENARIIFAGFSEPYLNESCSKMIKYASKIGRRVSLYTTLVGMTLEDFNEIKNVPFNEVVVHLPDEDGYAKIDVDATYLEVFEQMIAWKKEDGRSFIDYANCQSTPNRSLLELLKGKVRVFSELTDRAGNLEMDNQIETSKKSGRIYCQQSNELMHNILLPDGTVTLCCMDYGLKHKLGNLLLNDYESVSNSLEKALVIRGMRGDYEHEILCRKCSYAQPY